MQFDRGYISPYFVTDSENISVEYENCKVAVEEGIVVGGGCTLSWLASDVDAIKETLENDEQKGGTEIVRKSLSYPLELIAKNAGVNGKCSMVTEKVLANDNFRFGYNAATWKYEDLMAAGIIEPTKVAAAFGCLMLYVASLFSQKGKKRPNQDAVILCQRSQRSWTCGGTGSRGWWPARPTECRLIVWSQFGINRNHPCEAEDGANIKYLQFAGPFVSVSSTPAASNHEVKTDATNGMILSRRRPWRYGCCGAVLAGTAYIVWV